MDDFHSRLLLKLQLIILLLIAFELFRAITYLALWLSVETVLVDRTFICTGTTQRLGSIIFICLNFFIVNISVRSLDSSHSIASQLSSVHSSQDSLHKQPKKKSGLKSSLGRIFSKKEKAQKELAAAAAAAAAANRFPEGNDLRVQPPPDVISTSYTGAYFICLTS